MEDCTKTGVSVNTIGIIGTGVMGIQLSVILLQAGFNVMLKSRTDNALQNADREITNILRRIEASDRVKHHRSRLCFTTKFSDLVTSDIIIECIVEDILVKTQCFKQLSRICPDNIILATNTSSLSINEISENILIPERFIGIHFFNPAHKMQLVEIITSPFTSKHTLETALSLVKKLDKISLVLKSSPGFIVNRLLFTFLNEALHLLEQGNISEEQIDLAVKLGLNHPMGPFELMDFIGLDTCLSIMNNLHQATGNPQFSPSVRLQNMVSLGKIGRDREGFYHH